MRKSFFFLGTAIVVVTGACSSSSDSNPNAFSGSDDASSGGWLSGEGGGGGSGGSSGSSGGGGSEGGGSGDGGDDGGGTGPQGDGGSSSHEGGVLHDGGACGADPCPAPKGGITVACEKRFFYGVNYAWRNYNADFGGIQAYGQAGVSGNQAQITADLSDMKASGADVIRWWMFPKLEGDAVTFDASGTPTGLGGTVLADIHAALTIAAKVGVHFNLTLFSFDGFQPQQSGDTLTLHVLDPIITDAAKRAALMQHVVAAVAHAVESDPNGDRVVSWDVINEPEWAIAAGSDPYGDQPFTPTPGYDTVSFAQMETFVSDTAKTLHQNSSALVTLGSAAVKWGQAWKHAGLDYYTLHMYDWVNQYWPYTESLAKLNMTDKPVVIGEFPLSGLTGAAYGQVVSTLFALGYAGATAWAVTDPSTGNWSTAKADVKAFASSEACVTAY